MGGLASTRKREKCTTVCPTLPEPTDEWMREKNISTTTTTKGSAWFRPRSNKAVVQARRAGRALLYSQRDWNGSDGPKPARPCLSVDLTRVTSSATLTTLTPRKLKTKWWQKANNIDGVFVGDSNKSLSWSEASKKSLVPTFGDRPIRSSTQSIGFNRLLINQLFEWHRQTRVSQRHTETNDKYHRNFCEQLTNNATSKTTQQEERRRRRRRRWWTSIEKRERERPTTQWASLFGGGGFSEGSWHVPLFRSFVWLKK